MEQMEEKLGAILNNPQLMQQIMSMAQTLGQQPAQKEPNPPVMGFDPKLLGQLSTLANQNQTTGEEQALLQALCPYLRSERINKLEKAMRAAKMARFASGFLSTGGLQMLTGR